MPVSAAEAEMKQGLPGHDPAISNPGSVASWQAGSFRRELGIAVQPPRGMAIGV
jgi:hypothetical protein